VFVRAAPVLLTSAIVHGALIAYVGHLTMRPAPRRRPPLTAAIPIPPRPDAVPIEVAFLVEESTMPSIGTADPRTAGTAAPRVTTANTAAPSGTEPTRGIEPTRGTEPGKGTGFMRMRGPDLGLGSETAERIAISRTAPSDEQRKSGKLQSQPGGRAIVHDRVTTMSVEQDGSIDFEDKKDIDLRFKLPIPKVWEIEEMRKDLGHQLTEWFKDPEAGKRYGRWQDLPRHLQGVEGTCDSYADIMCEDPLAPKIEQRVRERTRPRGGGGLFGTILGGPMDITSWLHRKFIGDPYASRKLKLLDETFDERVEMGVAHRAQQQLRSGEYMQRNLERLWATERNPLARKAALFEMWDECEEDEAGLRARSIVIGWIRKYLPAGSPDAYTADEITTLQAHCTSSRPFAPYE
jgi:hypothetical protein